MITFKEFFLNRNSDNLDLPSPKKSELATQSTVATSEVMAQSMIATQDAIKYLVVKELTISQKKEFGETVS